MCRNALTGHIFSKKTDALPSALSRCYVNNPCEWELDCRETTGDCRGGGLCRLLARTLAEAKERNRRDRSVAVGK